MIPAAITLELGDSTSLRVVAAQDTSDVIAASDLVVTSSDSSIVFPSGFIELVGRKAGVATIETHLRNDPSSTVLTQVIVLPRRLLIVNPPTTLERGAIVQLTARETGAPTALNLVWDSSNQSIVGTVGSTVYANNLGTATVTVRDANDPTLAASAVITVVSGSVASIVPAPSSVVLHGSSDQALVDVRLRSAGGTVLTDRVPSVSTSNAAIAAVTGVSAAGRDSSDFTTQLRIAPRGPGVDTINVESGGMRASIVVTVMRAGADTLVVASTKATDLFETLNDYVAVDGNPSRTTIPIPPRHGTVAVRGSTGMILNYTSSPGYFGPDSLVYGIEDPQTHVIDTATVHIMVAPGPYTVVPVPTTGVSVVNGVFNNNGGVAGTVLMSDGSRQAFRWRGGVMENLAAPAAGDVSATAINDSGDVAGLVGAQPLLWRVGSAQATVLDLSVSAPDTVVAITADRRVVVGLGIGITYVWSPRPFETQTFRFSCAMPVGIEPDGGLLVNLCNSLYNNWDVVRGSTGTYGQCGAGRYSQAVAFNDSADVLGTAEVFSDINHVCLWRSMGGTQDITALTGHSVTGAVALNNRGWAAVTLGGRQGLDRFALFIGGGIAPLSALVSSTPWAIDRIVDLNDRGEILAFATNVQTNQRALVRLVPAAGPGLP